MAEQKWFAGVDWASQTHQASLLDGEGAERGNEVFAHSGTGLSAMADWLIRSAGMPAERIGVAIETPRGPVVESLLARGFAVYSINPKQLDRFRDRFSPAGAKDDRRDARVLASALRSDPDCLHRVRASDPVTVEMREWSRGLDELKGDRVQLTNRMGELLWRYYPQFTRTLEDLAAPWVLAVWKRAPNPAAARGMRVSSYDKLLKKHRIRRFDGTRLKRRLAERPLDVDPASARAVEERVRLLVERLQVVNKQIADAEGRLDAFLDQLGNAGPAPGGDGDPQPGQAPEQRDATILRSMPGVGRVVLATLLAEADDALRRRDYHALRCQSGIAPVTRQSGRSTLVTRRLAAHGRLRVAVCHLARVAAQHDPVCKARYQALRARGHGHHRALRSVADRLLKVACAMLRDGTPYDPARAVMRHASSGAANAA